MKATAFKRYINNGIYVYVEIDDRLRPIRFVNEKEIKMFCRCLSALADHNKIEITDEEKEAKL